MVEVTPRSDDSGITTPWLGTANRLLVGIGLALCTSSLLMRLYTKMVLMKRLWWDDLFIVAAWVNAPNSMSVNTNNLIDQKKIFVVGSQSMILYGYDHTGVGVHMADLSASTKGKLQKLVLAASIVYIPSLAFAKLALLMMYYRLLSAFRVWVYTLYFIGFVIVGYSIALTLALIFACDPLAKNWNPSIMRGSCVSRPGLYLATAATNTASDIVLILIPIQIIRNLRLRFVEKLGAILIFSIGCLTIITSILRLATIWPLVTSKDFSYELALTWTFASIEASFVILCGSVPYLRQFTRYYAPTWFPGRRSATDLQGPSDSPRLRNVRSPTVEATQEDLGVTGNRYIPDMIIRTEGRHN